MLGTKPQSMLILQKRFLPNIGTHCNVWPTRTTPITDFFGSTNKIFTAWWSLAGEITFFIFSYPQKCHIVWGSLSSFPVSILKKKSETRRSEQIFRSYPNLVMISEGVGHFVRRILLPSTKWVMFNVVVLSKPRVLYFPISLSFCQFWILFECIFDWNIVHVRWGYNAFEFEVVIENVERIINKFNCQRLIYVFHFYRYKLRWKGTKNIRNWKICTRTAQKHTYYDQN